MNIKITQAQTGPGGANTYIVKDDDSGKGFMVDPGGYVPEITKHIKDCGIQLEYIILTHGHGDHIGGVEGYRRDFPNGKVLACEKERELLNDPNLNLSNYMFPAPIVCEADVYVNDGDMLKIGEMELKFIHTPGHSPGGMCIYVDNILFSGDTLFASSIGRTDFEGASFEEIKKSIHEKIFILPDDTQVLPGHMGLTTIGYEKEHNPFV